MLIAVDGHTDPLICATAGGMVQAAVAGLMSLAATYPGKVECANVDALGIADRDPNDRDPKPAPTGEPMP
jgi:hypothetical protein